MPKGLIGGLLLGAFGSQILGGLLGKKKSSNSGATAEIEAQSAKLERDLQALESKNRSINKRKTATLKLARRAGASNLRRGDDNETAKRSTIGS